MAINSSGNSSEIVSRTFNGQLFGGITNDRLNEINHFLASDNFERVNWSFGIDRGVVWNITLSCQKPKKTLPFKFGIYFYEAPKGRIFGAWSTYLSGWSVEKALNDFQKQYPLCRIKSTRPIHSFGINYGVYILYTYQNTNS